MSGSARAAIDIAGYQIVWFACAFGAAVGGSWPGVAAAVVFLAAHMVTTTDRPASARAIGLAALAGALVETALVLSGLVRFQAAWPIATVAPAWIVALWAAFGAATGTMRGWLGGRIALAAGLGVVGGPLAYVAGERIGALSLGEPRWLAIAALAVIWGAAMPLFVAFPPRAPRG